MSARRRSSSVRGFSLVELMVVIGIIAMLIALLLPSLSKARAHAQTVACTSNLHQVALAMFAYSLDYKVLPGTVVDGATNLDWAGRNNAIYLANPSKYSHPFLTSVLHRYLGTDRILTCPMIDRPNHFYDYTMVMRMAGAKTTLRWPVGYPSDPANAASPEKFFPQMPVLIEEHQKFYNTVYDDGSWGNKDQFTTRHGGKANVAYLDGSVGLFAAPHGPKDAVEEAGDLTCNHLRLHVGPNVYQVSYTTAAEFGWANHPK